MHHLKNRVTKEELSDTGSGISTSSSSQRYSDLTTSAISASDPMTRFDDPYLNQFDIIDDLEFDDIDDGLIVDQELSYQERERLIREFYDSEKKYVDTLDIVLNSYITPMRKPKSSSFAFLGKKPPCTEREMRWLYGNFEQVHQMHIENLLALDERLSIWGPTQIISDVVQTWFPRIQQHYHAYFDNYDVAVTTYERLTRFQPFKKFQESVNKKEKGPPLLSLLQVPITCIQRYRKLLINLAEATSSMHPDYVGLMQCKQMIQSIYEEFKPKIEDARNVDQVYQTLINMTGQPFSVKAERRLYLQNDFGQESYFLFSDMVVFTKQKQPALVYKGHIPLERAKVKALKEDFSIELTCPFQSVDSLNSTFVGSSSTHIIKTMSESDQSKWLRVTEIVIARLDRTQQNKIMIGKKQGSSNSSSKRQATTISSGSTKSLSNASV